jgi:hypothetical protein
VRFIAASITALLISVLFVGAIQDSSETSGIYRKVRQNSFGAGERIEYRVHYGFINAGEAVMTIDKKIHTMNNRPCYKLDVTGRTTGVFDLMMNVRDNWGSYIDTAAIVSQRFYQNIEEGKYRKKEIIEFDHVHDMAIAHRLDKESGKLKKKLRFPVPEHIQDIVSGYYYMRTFDFDTIQPNDFFDITGFYDDTTYYVKVQYLGKEKLKTKIGDYNALVISPIMPKNSLFRGDNPVKAYLSDDKYKIPLKVKAELLVGSLEIDIREYRSAKK